MNPELQQIFHSTPEEEPRSKLEPYCELMFRWRRQGRSYRRICELLAERCNVKVAYGPLYRYIQRRSRARKKDERIVSAIEPKSTATDVQSRPSGEPTSSGQPTATIQRSAEYLAKLAHMQALKAMPLATTTVHKRYVYNPDEPLILEKPEKENKR